MSKEQTRKRLEDLLTLETREDTELVTMAVYLYKVHFANAANLAGGTVTYLSQHSMIWGALGNGFSKSRWLGVCAGLSIEWIKSRTKGRDFVFLWETVKNDIMANKVGERVTVQPYAERIERSHEQQENPDGALSDLRPMGMETVAYPFEKLGRMIAKGHYFYMSTATHVMAGVKRGDGKIDFYDPNVGQVVGTTDPFLPMYSKNCVEATSRAKKERLISVQNERRKIGAIFAEKEKARIALRTAELDRHPSTRSYTVRQYAPLR